MQKWLFSILESNNHNIQHIFKSIMNKNYHKLLASTCMVVCLLGTPKAMAQAVIFPQQQQAGIALVEVNGEEYVLKNDLLSASFIRTADGKLLFNGCKAMNLKPGSELFKVILGNGTALNASDMKLESVDTEELNANIAAAKGSERFAGKAIKAVFSKDNLTIEWRAVLRDGSHYLRTDLNITAKNDQAMQSVTPMIYTVDNIAAGSAPAVVGNTRGAVLASDKIFAGLETPMGVNAIKTENAGIENFTPKSWTTESFNFSPGTDTPADILKIRVEDDGKYFDLTPEDIKAAQGYVTFREAGEQTVTFQYKGGAHRLQLVGVDVIKAQTDEVVAHDYHFGYTGGKTENNVFTLNIPEKGTYLIRYFVETASQTIESNGSITFSKPIGTPVVVYDLMTEASKQSKAIPTTKLVPAVKAADVKEGYTFVEDEARTEEWTPNFWTKANNKDVPARILEMGHEAQYIYKHEQPVNIQANKAVLNTEFLYKNGNNRLQIVGVDLLQDGAPIAYDYHFGFTGSQKADNTYQVKLPYNGQFTLRYLVSMKNEANTSNGTITSVMTAAPDTIHLPAPTESPMEGYWRRNTTLKGGTTWNVSSVVGLIAPGQSRRSFLAYSERERAVPWRAMPVYISWYELNIDRNNSEDYSKNMTEEQCAEVVNHWYEKFYKPYGKAPVAFVWDDGWDHYGTWTFNKNFPNGFSAADKTGRLMGAGQGAWLGPVGGYGQSGTYRRNYWKDKGGMQLSNKDYYDTFMKACTSMIDKYDFRFFKFDGISAQWSALGPDAGDTGIENAEGIISLEREVRKKKADIFFNTTVGTWASPFWFHFSDAVWRQENDWSVIGNQGDDRERWITYRDRLVYQNFVQNSPLCPINTIMTHGFILTKFGQVSKSMDYKGIVREMRCAFACGSGMVELYNDFKLMDEINGGKLWADLAECIDWQKRNEDVLPDIHWVGGNPWDGAKANIYGWASWNGKKATLALRNPSASAQTIKITLRKALDIPEYVSTQVIWTSSFKDQPVLNGLKMGEAIDIDKELTINMPASSVFVFEGIDQNPLDINPGPTGIGQVTAKNPIVKDSIYDLSGRQLPVPHKGINIINGQKMIK